MILNKTEINPDINIFYKNFWCDSQITNNKKCEFLSKLSNQIVSATTHEK